MNPKKFIKSEFIFIVEGKNIRDSKGRFVCGNTPLNPRDKKTGKFTKKEKLLHMSPAGESVDGHSSGHNMKTVEISTLEEKVDKIIYEAIKRKRENIYEYIWGD